MTMRNITMAVWNNNLIHVDKDCNFQLNSNEKFDLAHLRHFALSGPFGTEVVKYLLNGCDKLKTLNLGIEWHEPHFCHNQPVTRKDLLSKETDRQHLFFCFEAIFWIREN